MREPYLLDGVEVPSVTEVLSMYGGGMDNLMVWSNNLGKKGKDYREELDHTANIGSCVHELIEAYLTGEPTRSGWKVSEVASAKKCMDSFQVWAQDKNIHCISHEKRLVSRAWGVGGTYDLLCTIDDGPVVLVDFKTASAIRPKNIAQVAMYVQMVNECEDRAVDQACILRFGRNGSAGELWLDADLMGKGMEVFMLAKQLWDVDQQLQLDVKRENPLFKYIPNTPNVRVNGQLTYP